MANPKMVHAFGAEVRRGLTAWNSLRTDLDEDNLSLPAIRLQLLSTTYKLARLKSD